MLIDLFVSAAMAQDATSAASSPISTLVPMLLVLAVFYVLIIRPQQKKMKHHQAMIGSIQRGDQVITGGGIHAKVVRVEEGGKLKLQIAEGVEITVEQSTISNVLNKPGADATGKKEKSPKPANDNA